MIRNVFDRPMFQNPNIRRSVPGGIMASSPELIRVGTANANPLVSSQSNKIQIPMYQNKEIPLSELLTSPLTIPNKIDPNQKLNTGDIEGTGTQENIQQQKEKSNLEKLKEVALRNKIAEGATKADDFDPKIGAESQKTVEKAEKDYYADDDFPNVSLSNEGSGKASSSSASSKSDASLLSGFESKQKGLSDRMTAAIANLSSGLGSAEDIKLGGKTVVENTNALVAKMQEKGEEPTLADVQDDAIQLLGFDPKELEGEFEEDRKASIFLNMMKAGLAIAAGESPNAITNIAKGFGVGLQGYGEDVNRLNKNLREDRREARNTMYNLLKDAKSESIAKRTLELQQMEGVVNIQRQLVGDKRQKALDAFNQQITGLKFNADLLSAAADMGFKEKQLQVTKDNVEKTFRAAILRSQPEIISLLKAKGDMKLKEGLTKEIPYGEEGYLDQYDLTPKGEKSIEDYLKELKKGGKGSLNSGSEFNVKRKNIANTGQVSIVPTPPGFTGASDDIKESYGIAGEQLMEDLGSLSDGIDRFNRIVEFVRSQKGNFPGMTIPESSLSGDVKKYLQGKKSGGGTNAADYADVLEISSN
jgi:hypothetical protein